MKQRSMKRCKGILLIILLVFSIPYTYGGCVVIYSSGDVDRNDKRIYDKYSGGFTGRTSAAVITQMNAEDLAVGALTGGTKSNEPKSFKLNRLSNAVQKDIFRPLRIPRVLGKALLRIQLDPAQFLFSQTNIISENDNLEGTCSGDSTYALDLNKITEIFSGHFLFGNFCDKGTVISGETDVDGTFEVNTGKFNSATFSFSGLSVGSNYLDGEISIDFSDYPILAAFTAYSKDEQDGHVYWMKEYSINLSEFAGHVEIEIFGTFYHPDDGFVNLSTSKHFVVFNEDDWPASGQLIIEGDDNTFAQLTVIDHLSYKIAADTDGDEIFDWDSGILCWTAM